MDNKKSLKQFYGSVSNYLIDNTKQTVNSAGSIKLVNKPRRQPQRIKKIKKNGSKRSIKKPAIIMVHHRPPKRKIYHGSKVSNRLRRAIIGRKPIVGPPRLKRKFHLRAKFSKFSCYQNLEKN